MKLFPLLTFLLVFSSIHSQNRELKNEKLIKYYEAINSAEDKIVINDLDSADFLLSKSF